MSGVGGGGGGGGRCRQLLAAPRAWKASLGPDVPMIAMKRSVGAAAGLKSVLQPPCTLSCSALVAVRPGDGDRVYNSRVGP